MSVSNILDLIKKNLLVFLRIFQMSHVAHQYLIEKVKNTHCINNANIKKRIID